MNRDLPTMALSSGFDEGERGVSHRVRQGSLIPISVGFR